MAHCVCKVSALKADKVLKICADFLTQEAVEAISCTTMRLVFQKNDLHFAVSCGEEYLEITVSTCACHRKAEKVITIGLDRLCALWEETQSKQKRATKAQKRRDRYPSMSAYHAEKYS